jgi:hypothetical protein
MPSGGLASRRGGQTVKPLSFDAIKQAPSGQDNGVPTPRTSRGHLLAGLRTAPKSATAASFGLQSPSTAGPVPQFARPSAASNAAHGAGQDNMFNAPKTAFPQYGAQQSQYQNMANQHYTVDQVLAPPELSIDEQTQQQMDPNLYAQLVATNMYLAQQQQRLQQQLRSVQQAAQQFQHLNINNPQLTQHQMALYEQQQQLNNMQQQLGLQAAMSQGQQVYVNTVTGQYYVDTSAASHVMQARQEQPMSPGYFEQQQQFQFKQQQTPRVQVSPPPENRPSNFRSVSPPKRRESPPETAPLPPPSANAFRRSHKKLPSLAPVNSDLASASCAADSLRSAGPRTASFPLSSVNGYGPGQARAGEHPVRQPRGPPALDELKAKPTAKHEGSKNFATRTRRSAVHNLVRAGLERRKGTGSSAGSMSPVSETAEESTSPITDNDSDSGRSGSGSLAGEMECTSSRTSASGSWGAIGSDRPSSRSKSRRSADSVCSTPTNGEADNGSFANVFKNGALRAAKDSTDGQRKPSRLVLTSAEKRKTMPGA